ncbi:DUF11 domain-containing protein [Candidatus Saccharibacteria bacterium]|nr:DUF11 domain-containing protein [Candidatus Saccharibacteria bacterium]
MKRGFKKLSLSILTLGLASAGFIGVTTSDTYALVDTPWGPDRTTFTWADPAPYATFNSITDNPQLGDERNFVRVREVKDGEKFGDEVSLEAGKTYEVYIYYHNNADAHDVGKTAIGIADGAAMKSSFPAVVKAGEKATVTGTIFASDTNPLEVWDGAYMTTSQDIYLRYIPGTATIHNGGALNGQPIGADYLFGDGALLGYNKFSGLLPGCNEYAGYVTYQLFADAPGFNISKSVVGDNYKVKAGDVITFKVRYDNTGTMDQENVVILDTLPDSLEYVAGSAILYNNNFPDGKPVNDDIVTEHGMNIGNYAGGNGWAEVTYNVIVKDSVNCGDMFKNAVTVSTDDGNKNAEVELTVDDGNCVIPEKTCATNPEMEGCQELPNTGPVEIIMATVIIIGIGGGGYYLYRANKTLKTVENAVSGKDASKDSSQKSDDMV